MASKLTVSKQLRSTSLTVGDIRKLIKGCPDQAAVKVEVSREDRPFDSSTVLMSVSGEIVEVEA